MLRPVHRHWDIHNTIVTLTNEYSYTMSTRIIECREDIKKAHKDEAIFVNRISSKLTSAVKPHPDIPQLR